MENSEKNFIERFKNFLSRNYSDKHHLAKSIDSEGDIPEDPYRIGLTQRLANAFKTHALCRVNSKKERNQHLIDRYHEQMRERNMEIPTDNELLEKGIFNGLGSDYSKN